MRKMSVFLSRDDYMKVRSALKVGMAGNLWDFQPSSCDDGVYIEIQLNGSYFHILDDVFSAYIDNWE